MNKEKKLVAVIFGGQSSEHDVSCVSAVTIIKNMDATRYEQLLIGITKEGRWLLVDNLEAVEDGTWRQSQVSAVLSPDATQKSILLIKEGQITYRHPDIIFSVLHGMYGEDGTIQGLFELAGIPYVGCGVLASAVSMDKVYTKEIVARLNIRQARYVTVHRLELQHMDEVIRRIEAQLPYPVFVKPSKAGSSCGVGRAENKEALKAALFTAADHDCRILVEETIKGREIECAVLGGFSPEASNVGEILAADTFYTYDAKYNNAESKTDLNPSFPEGILEEVRADAIAIFKAVDGFGLSRVDFFLEEGSNQVVFNEINTLPGFTSISMYPMLWEERGLKKKALITKLIEMAPLRNAI